MAIMPRSEVISLEDRRAMRRAKMPDALTAEQLRKTAVGRMRWALTALVEDNSERVQGWLDLVAMTDGPKEALEFYIKLLEFAVPKLSRAEVSVEDGGKTQIAQLTMQELQAIMRGDGSIIQGTSKPIPEDKA